MKRLCILIPLLLYGSTCLADSQAVRATNFQLSYVSGDINTSGGSDSRTNGLQGSAIFPLMNYIGASVFGDYSHSTLATNFPNPNGGLTPLGAVPHCVVNNGDLGVGLFARDQGIGKVGISYGSGETKAGCASTFLASGTDKLKSKDYAASAEYYFPRITIALSRSQTRFSPTGKFDSDALTGSWYPTNILRAGLSAEGLDLKKTYILDLEYQPVFLDNSAGLSISYSIQHQAVTSRIVMVGISYYFGNRVDLLTRDRAYR
ncbi:MAG: hypothetical protein ACYDDO_00105 [Acidiferrobacterales bacterium]